MPRKSEALTVADRATVTARRAEARKRAKALIAADDETPRVVADPENPPLTDEQLAQFRPAHETRPALIAAQLKRERGRPRAERPKRLVSIRLDQDVLDRLRATGEGWQSRINDTLRKALGI